MKKGTRGRRHAWASIVACLAALASLSWQSPESLAAGRPAHTTPTTVMGGGSPSTWPAARRVAPSLAGAYSTNPKKAFVTLVNYSDWLGSHPNPSLVKNFMLPSCNVYTYSVNLMRILAQRHWHDYPNPTVVDYLRIIRKPLPILTRKHKPLVVKGHRAYTGGVVDAVVIEKNVPYLNIDNKIVGYSGGGGATAIAVTLNQGSSDGRFRIENWRVVKPEGGIAAWERTQGRPK